MNFKSALPTASKLHSIRNERNRIKKHCSDIKDSKKFLKQFDGILRLNGYPESFISKSNRRSPRRAAENLRQIISQHKAPFFLFFR